MDDPWKGANEWVSEKERKKSKENPISTFRRNPRILFPYWIELDSFVCDSPFSCSRLLLSLRGWEGKSGNVPHNPKVFFPLKLRQRSSHQYFRETKFNSTSLSSESGSENNREFTILIVLWRGIKRMWKHVGGRKDIKVKLNVIMLRLASFSWVWRSSSFTLHSLLKSSFSSYDSHSKWVLSVIIIFHQPIYFISFLLFARLMTLSSRNAEKRRTQQSQAL